jgi:hypothetical protein
MKKEILENKKIIAEFDGWVKIGINWEKNISPDTITRNYGGNFQYDSSWDWLMPVIEKIETHGYYVSIMKSNVTCCKDWGIRPVYESYDYTSKIEATYQAVLAFIKMYNEKSLKN